jgi:arylamine N-acetyltransferase
MLHAMSAAEGAPAVSDARLSEAQLAAYLGTLGAPHKEPSIGALRQLVRAQLTRVPFENVSKLLFRQRGVREVPDLETYLEGIRRYHLGGTCYPNAFHFYRLLCTLGYDAALCGAAMRSGEDVHAAVTVAIDGRDLLVDVGYGAPFLEPLPRDAGADIVVEQGRDRYVLKPQDSRGHSRLETYRDDELRHGYVLNPTPRPIEHFHAVVRDSFRADATFMNAVVVIRHGEAGSVAIHNLVLSRSSRDGWSEESLPDRAALVAAIEREFEMPAEITHEAIAGLGPLADVHG